MGTTMLSMGSINLGSYVCFIKKLSAHQLAESERDMQITQYLVFETIKGGVLENSNNST